MRLGRVGRNVAELSHRPKRQTNRKHQRTSRRALTRTELKTLLDAASGIDVIVLDLIDRNGLRTAAARALTWNAIDLGKSLLTVELQMDEDDDPASVKTNASLRTIRIDGRTTRRLIDWRHLQAEMKEQNRAR